MKIFGFKLPDPDENASWVIRILYWILRWIIDVEKMRVAHYMDECVDIKEAIDDAVSTIPSDLIDAVINSPMMQGKTLELLVPPTPRGIKSTPKTGPRKLLIKEE